MPSSAGCRGLSPDEGARLEVCVHVYPGVLPLPGGERPGQNQEAAIDSEPSGLAVISVFTNCTHKCQKGTKLCTFSTKYLHLASDRTWLVLHLKVPNM